MADFIVAAEKTQVTVTLTRAEAHRLMTSICQVMEQLPPIPVPSPDMVSDAGARCRLTKLAGELAQALNG